MTAPAWWLSGGEPGALTRGDGWLSELERRRADSMRFSKRRNEFLVARLTLKQAVATALGRPLVDDELARIEARHASDGAPELYVDGRPAPFDVSLTDRAGWAVCLLVADGAGPGCDLELVEPRTPAFVRDYLTEAEQSAVSAYEERCGADGVALVANLVWSAKESALKVLRTGLRRDTRSVQVVIEDIDAPERTWSALTVHTVEGETFDGWWRRSGAFVLTMCARAAALPPPSALDEPPALDSAQPLHSWTGRQVAMATGLRQARTFVR